MSRNNLQEKRKGDAFWGYATYFSALLSEISYRDGML